MIASLPMYDMPHLRDAHDRYWQAIHTALGYGPQTLTRDADPWTHWRSPDLLLSQTCGLPFRVRLHDQVQLIGTPDYRLPDCPRGYYFSYLIQRRDDPRDLPTLARDGVFARNDPLSQSGWAAPLQFLQDRGLRPAHVIDTGAHLASLRQVIDGTADFAAIDAVTFHLWADHAADDLPKIAATHRTDPTPGLPYITALGTDPAPLADAIRTAIRGMAHDDLVALRLNGLVQIDASEYRAIPVPDEIAVT
ncbi:MAG: PhnD/SsuA/transferrin family substrate-binding protein [Pseudomonadota bacterium]